MAQKQPYLCHVLILISWAGEFRYFRLSWPAKFAVRRAKIRPRPVQHVFLRNIIHIMTIKNHPEYDWLDDKPLRGAIIFTGHSSSRSRALSKIRSHEQWDRKENVKKLKLQVRLITRIFWVRLGSLNWSIICTFVINAELILLFCEEFRIYDSQIR